MSTYEDKLEDAARKAITYSKTVGDIYDLDPEEFIRQVTLMVTPPKYEPGMNPSSEALAKKMEFVTWLVEQSSTLHYVKLEAQRDWTDEQVFKD